jgi:LmbE family N-acetylglucosaminyl deacetylase
MKILVIAAHPDDELLGCGGTILKHVEKGDEVHLCIVTKPIPKYHSADIINEKKQEVIDVSKRLGIKKIHFCDFPTGELDTVPLFDISQVILDHIKAIQPVVVYTNHKGDVHKDHQLVFEATMGAIRPKEKLSVKKVLCYECSSSTEWAPPLVGDVFMPNVYVDISSVLEKKLEIMSLYKTELKKYPHPRSVKALEIAAKKHGIDVGLDAAERFMLVREVI